MGASAGMKRIEVGGVIYTEGAQKAARFIMGLQSEPGALVFMHDVNGFMVGKDAEWSGNYSRRRKDGVGGEHQRGAQDHGHHWRKLWGGPLCDVRQGI